MVENARAMVFSLFLAFHLASAYSEARADDRAATCAEQAAPLRDFITCLRDTFRRTAEPQAAECDHHQVATVPPIEGRVLVHYGDLSPHGSRSKGTVIETAAGAAIALPAEGFVLFAGEWRSYGNVVIVDTGCGTELVIAGDITPAVAAGDTPARDGVIGRVVGPSTWGLLGGA